MISTTRFLSLLCLLSAPSAAAAKSALLPGLSTGGSISSSAKEPTTVHFRIGTGLDWLHESGFTLLSRLETTHEIDTTLAFLVGWSFSGLRENRGLPLGLSFGGQLAVDRHGETRAGGRAQLALALWYSRAVLELDGALQTPTERTASSGTEVVFGLSLRVVPWEPWQL